MTKHFNKGKRNTYQVFTVFLGWYRIKFRFELQSSQNFQLHVVTQKNDDKYGAIDEESDGLYLSRAIEGSGGF